MASATHGEAPSLGWSQRAVSKITCIEGMAHVPDCFTDLIFSSLRSRPNPIRSAKGQRANRPCGRPVSLLIFPWSSLLPASLPRPPPHRQSWLPAGGVRGSSLTPATASSSSKIRRRPHPPPPRSRCLRPGRVVAAPAVSSSKLWRWQPLQIPPHRRSLQLPPHRRPLQLPPRWRPDPPPTARRPRGSPPQRQTGAAPR
jgi:hypothetical protein